MDIYFCYCSLCFRQKDDKTLFSIQFISIQFLFFMLFSLSFFVLIKTQFISIHFCLAQLLIYMLKTVMISCLYQESNLVKSNCPPLDLENGDTHYSLKTSYLALTLDTYPLNIHFSLLF